MVIAAVELVLVPVAIVEGVAMAVVDVIDVISVRNGLVSAAGPVLMVIVIVVGDVFGRNALVPMAVMFAVSVAVVDEVDVVAVGDRLVSAVGAVGVGVILMNCARGAHGEFLRVGRGRRCRPRCG